jgi:hypothetical protein
MSEPPRPMCLCQLSGAPVIRVVQEFAITRDDREPLFDDEGHENGWRCIPVRPEGPGWEIYDETSDRKTKWRRLIIVAVEQGEGLLS